jgi:hypothetical protein
MPRQGLRVAIWNEGVAAICPDGIHGALAAALGRTVPMTR